MNLNQLTIIGFIGRNAETKQLPNGTAVTKFSVATTQVLEGRQRRVERQERNGTTSSRSDRASPRWRRAW